MELNLLYWGLNGNIISSAANGNAEGTSFGNGLTPTYWSASQLLKEHEERKKRESLAAAAAPGMMPPVPEQGWTNRAIQFSCFDFSGHPVGF